MRYIYIEYLGNHKHLVYDPIDKQEKEINQVELVNDCQPFDWSGTFSKMKGRQNVTQVCEDITGSRKKW